MNKIHRPIDLQHKAIRPVKENSDLTDEIEFNFKKPFDWKNASVTLLLIILAIWSAYYVTVNIQKDSTSKDAKSTQDKTVATDSAVTPPSDSTKTGPPDLPAASSSDSATTDKTLTPADVKEVEQPKSTTTPTKDSFSIKILNGNGVTGDASKLKTDLTTLGFKVGDIGNAKLKYDKTQVYYIAGKQAEGKLVADNLTGKVVEQSEADASLVGEGYTVLIIIGKS